MIQRTQKRFNKKSLARLLQDRTVVCPIKSKTEDKIIEQPPLSFFYQKIIETVLEEHKKRAFKDDFEWERSTKQIMRGLSICYETIVNMREQETNQR